MPQTVAERVIAVVILAVTALLAVLVLREVQRDEDPQARATVAQVLAETSPAPAAQSRVVKAQPAPAPAKRKTVKTARTRLVLTASGGDTWFEARSGSAQGKVLYVGTLPQGQSVRFSGPRLWVRFGGASNLSATLNGKPLELIPGTYSALIGPKGLRQVPG